MSNKRTRTYGSQSTTRTTVESTARLYPDVVARHAGEHAAFVDPARPAGFTDAHGTVWFDFSPDWPPCGGCSLPVRPNRRTCGSRLCMGAL